MVLSLVPIAQTLPKAHHSLNCEPFARGASTGGEPKRLAQLEALLSELLSMSLDALRRLIKMGKRTEAQISADMLVASYPNSQAAQACLDEVLAMPT